MNNTEINIIYFKLFILMLSQSLNKMHLQNLSVLTFFTHYRTNKYFTILKSWLKSLTFEVACPYNSEFFLKKLFQVYQF